MMFCVYSKINVTVSEDTAFPLVRKKTDLKWQKGKIWAFFPPFLDSNFSSGFK